MRQLFLPACVFLVTWSGATNSDPRLTMDEFTGVQQAAKRGTATHQKVASLIPQDSAQDFVSSAVEESVKNSDPAPAEVTAPKRSDAEVTAILSGLAIEAPVPSGVIVNNGIPAGIPLPPIPKPVIARTEEEVCGSLTEAAQRNNLPAPFFIRLLFQESRFKPGVVSSAGAQGIAQFMPNTAADMGLDNPFDPLQAIPASARLLRDLFDKFGNLGLAAAAYNAGPKRIADWLADRRKNKLPEETQGYVKTITGRPVEKWSVANARHPGPKLPRHAPCQASAGLLAWNGPDLVPLPAPAPARVAAVVPAKNKPEATAKTGPVEKPKAKAAAKAEAKAEVKPAVTPKVAPKTKPPATTQLAARKPKPERIAQR